MFRFVIASYLGVAFGIWVMHTQEPEDDWMDLIVTLLAALLWPLVIALNVWNAQSRVKSGIFKKMKLHKLTNNQKAASYIGWQPKIPCTERHVEYFTSCPCGSWADPDEPHYRAEPKMFLPENYMRAFEKLQQRDDIYADVAFLLCTEGFVCSLGDDYGRKSYRNGASGPIEGIGKTLGDAACATLVVLYDAEYKEPMNE